MTARTFLFDPLMAADDADAIVRLAEDFGGHGLYSVEMSETRFAPELPQRWDAVRNQIATGGLRRETGSPRDLALRTSYLRETYAYGEEILAPGIEGFRTHAGLLDAARQLYDRPVVEPAIVYANIILPGQELAVHTDVPEFRGANRKLFPQWLMVVMHHSGLFEPWRMPIATAVSYFGTATGGELVYHPDGPDGPARRMTTKHNTAIVLDTDSVFHGVDRVGGPDAAPPPVRDGNVLRFVGDGRWTLFADAGEDGEVLAEYHWDEIRFSISWKAYCFADEAERAAWRTHADDLSLERILDDLCADLADRGLLASPGERPGERELADLLIDTYERFPAAA